MLAGARRQPQPARHQHPQHVAVGEQRDVALDAARARAITRSTRAPTSAGVSPPGQPSRKMSQPGAVAWICAGVRPSYFP